MTNSVTSLVTIENKTPLADSREIAKNLGVGHSDFFNNLIKKYQAEIEEDFGSLRFQNGVKSGPQRGKLPQYALLTEDQAYAYLAYSKNTPQARACKRKLVKAFSEARTQIFSQIAPRSAPLPLPEPIFKTTKEAWSGEPLCPCPTQEEMETAILSTVQALQPHYPSGVSASLLMRYNASIQAYIAVNGAHGLLAIVDSLIERTMLLCDPKNGKDFYAMPVLAGQIH